MIISEWALNEKILIERFKNHCISNGLITLNNKEEWQIAFDDWKEIYRNWLKEHELNDGP